MMSLPGLSGFTLCRNAIKLDYCLELAVKSMLPICDEVVICDADSTDGTKEMIHAWAAENPNIRICNWTWPDPKGDFWFYVKWLNHARQHLRYDMMLLVEGDECLHEDSLMAIRAAADAKQARIFERLNFWGSPRDISPDGTYCGHVCVRLGPTRLHMPTDAPDPLGSQEIATLAHEAGAQPGFQIFHYGTLRKKEAFLAKSRVMQSAIWDSFDSRLETAETTGQDWIPLCTFDKPMKVFNGIHPIFAREWLEQRGHKL